MFVWISPFIIDDVVVERASGATIRLKLYTMALVLAERCLRIFRDGEFAENIDCALDCGVASCVPGHVFCESSRNFDDLCAVVLCQKPLIDSLFR